MADADTEELLRKLTEEIRKNGAIFEKAADQIEKTLKKSDQNATKEHQTFLKALKDTFGATGAGGRYTKVFEDEIKTATNSVGALGKSANLAAQGLQSFAKTILNGSGISDLMGSMSDLSKQYDAMATMSESLSGDMMKMSQWAARAGVTLEQFSDIVGKNKDLMDKMAGGQEGFADLMAAVERQAKEYEDFGYNIRELTDFTTKYLDVMKDSTKLSEMNADDLATSIGGLAAQMTMLATVYGKSRSQLEHEVLQLQHNEAFQRRLQGMSAMEQQNYVAAMSRAVAALAAQPGEAGPIFAKMLVETAAQGGAAFTEGAQTFIDAGMTKVVPAMEKLASNLERALPEDAVELQARFLEEFRDELNASSHALRANAAAGNASAKRIMGMSAALRSAPRAMNAQKARMMDTRAPAMARMIDNLAAGVEEQSAGFLSRVGSSIKAINTRWRMHERLMLTNDSESWVGGKRNVVHKTGKAIHTSLSFLGKSAEEAGQGFKDLIKNVFGGVIIAGLYDYFSGLTKTYRKLMDTGASFSDGLLGMSRAASKAGLTLDEFADFVSKNSVAAANAGGAEALGEFAKQVRAGAESAGLYGYSIEGFNDVIGETMSTMTIFNKNLQTNDKALVDTIRNVARDASGIAKLFGKDRKEIVRDREEALRNTFFLSKAMGMQQDQLEQLQNSIGSAITTFAGIPGQAGKILPKMLAEAAGLGTSIFSEGGRMFIDAGMGQIVPMFDQYAKRLQETTDPDEQATLQADLNNTIYDQIAANQRQLRVLALTNPAAKALIDNFSTMKRVTAEEIKTSKKKADQDNALTANVLSFSNIWGRMSGDMREKIIGVSIAMLDGVQKAFKKFEESGGFKKLGDAMFSILKTIGSWVGANINDTDALGDSIGKVLTGLLEKLANGFALLAKFFDESFSGPEGFAKLAGIVTSVVAGFVLLKNGIDGLSSVLTAVAGAVATAFAIKTITPGAPKAPEAKAPDAPKAGEAAGSKGAAGETMKPGFGKGGMPNPAAVETAQAASKWIRKFGKFGMALDVAGGAVEAYILNWQHENGLIDDKTYKSQMSHLIASRLGGWAGAMAFGTVGAEIGAAGGALAGGVGAVPGALVGGLVGSVGGYMAGSSAGSTLTDMILGEGNFASPQTPATPGSPRVEMSDQAKIIDEKIQSMGAQYAELGQKLAAAKAEDPNDRQVVAIQTAMQALLKAIEEQTEQQRILLMQNNRLTKEGNRALENSGPAGRG